ncbi:MAG: hydrogenase 2 operon protein HybA [Deltaproteobacteria bacterium]|nr:hydrogenase 2 operon protein HybA [Deltaproteobacteria bacterium]
MLSRRDFLSGAAGGVAAAAVATTTTDAGAREAKPMPDHALGLLFDGTLCIGCRACVAACKEANGMPPERTMLEGGDYWDAPLDLSGKTLNVIKCYRDGAGTRKDEVNDGFAFTKTSCMHCVDPSCVSVCPVSAMTKDPVTGIVKYSLEACIGCRYCVAACPFGVPRFTYDEAFPRINKCQLCEQRHADGGYSACAEVCPTGATLYGRVKDLQQEVARRKALTPGAKTTYPRGRLGNGDSYQGVAKRYVDHVYGEKEIGGTQVLHLSGVPFELLNKPKLPLDAPARVAETLQGAIYHALMAPIGFLGALLALAYRHMRPADPPLERGVEPGASVKAREKGGEP